MTITETEIDTENAAVELREEDVDLTATAPTAQAPDTEAPDTEDAATEKAEKRGRLRAVIDWPATLSARARGVLVGSLVAVIVAGGVGLGFTWWAAESAAADRAAGQSALDAARSDVPELLSYDYRNIDKVFPESAKKLLTGTFLTEYTELGASVIQPAAKRDSIVTKADVVEASVVSATVDEVTVLLFVNQTTTSKQLEGPRLDGSRVRVQMVKDGDSWKISEFTPV